LSSVNVTPVRRSRLLNLDRQNGSAPISPTPIAAYEIFLLPLRFLEPSDLISSKIPPFDSPVETLPPHWPLRFQQCRLPMPLFAQVKTWATHWTVSSPVRCRIVCMILARLSLGKKNLTQANLCSQYHDRHRRSFATDMYLCLNPRCDSAFSAEDLLRKSRGSPSKPSCLPKWYAYKSIQATNFLPLRASRLALRLLGFWASRWLEGLISSQNQWSYLAAMLVGSKGNILSYS